MPTNRFDRFIKMAERYVDRCGHHQHRLVSLVIKSDNIISIGWNSAHIHSEHAAINRAWRSDIRGCAILTVRFRHDGSIGISKPCALCLERIKNAGIRKVYYSDRSSNIEMMKVSSSDVQLRPEQLRYPFINTHHKPKANRYT